MTYFNRCRPQPLFVPTIACFFALAAAFFVSFLPTRSAKAGNGRHRLGGVSGRVSLPNGDAAGAATVVWLEAPGLHSPPLRHAVMDQRDKRFLPHVLVVTPGTRIQFPNNDTVFHNVFAYFEAKRFDLGMYPRGATKVQVFDKAGIVSILCNVHPTMSAFIVIIDSPYRAMTDKKGTFHFDDVSPGTYTVRAWQESGATVSAKWTVGEGDTAPLALKLERH